MRAITYVLLAAALGLAASASAAPVKPWIAMNGSWATYSMKDVNGVIGVINSQLDSAGVHLDEIKNGFGFGAAVGVDVPLATVGVGYERLTASSDLSVAGASLTFSHPGNAIRGFVEYKLPVTGPVGLHLGVAGGMVSEAGKLEVESITDGAMSIKLSGSGPLIEGYLGSTFWAMPRFGLTGVAGYRYAKIFEVKGELAGVKKTMKNPDDSNMSIDYSGVFLRLGFKVALTD